MHNFKLNEIVKVDYHNIWLSGYVVEVKTRLTLESFEVNYNVMLFDGKSTIVQDISEDKLIDMQECYQEQFEEILW